MNAYVNHVGENLLDRREEAVAALSNSGRKIYESLNLYASWDFSSPSQDERQSAYARLKVLLDELSIAEVRNIRTATKAHLECVSFTAISATTCAASHDNSALAHPADALAAIDKYLQGRQD